MAEIARKQDLAPPGGYAKIFWERNPARKYWNTPSLIAAYIGSTALGLYMFHRTADTRRKELAEAQSGNNAIMPFLLAERDRLYLRQLRKNRDDEASLMKNVEGWEVGTLYGLPVYQTLSPDQWVDPSYDSFYAHVSEDDELKRTHFYFWC